MNDSLLEELLRARQSRTLCAFCGGEVTIMIEPQNLTSALFLVGAGHCSLAIAKFATDCGMDVTVVEDRADLLENFPTSSIRVVSNAADFISKRDWSDDEAL